ncbi:hypothetical protein [Kitasatospora indigofera]|uniref:hypothetical protein n=1 Tax=Kitasatospora indigofera TaxID=67307 RepID=UPI0033A228F2
MHNLKFDPSTREGSQIIRLFNRIKDDIEDTDGWNGGDVVDVLCEWFKDLGIDVDADAIGSGPDEPTAAVTDARDRFTTGILTRKAQFAAALSRPARRR